MPFQALPQAPSLNNSFDSALDSYVQSKRDNQRLQDKFVYDEFQRKKELLAGLNPEVLNKNFDKDVVNAGIGELKNSVRDYLKKNPYDNSHRRLRRESRYRYVSPRGRAGTTT